MVRSPFGLKTTELNSDTDGVHVFGFAFDSNDRSLKENLPSK